MLKLIRKLRVLSKTVTEPVYADKATVDYQRRRADHLAYQMEANFKQETGRIRQELHKLQVEMNDMKSELSNLRNGQ